MSISTVTVDTLSAWGFSEFISAGREAGLTAEDAFPVLDSAAGPRVRQGGRELVNLASCAPFGFHVDPGVLAHASAAAAEFGLVTGGSRALQGVSWPIRDLEELIAEVTGKQRAITFATGLLANIGFVHAMSGNFNFARDCGVDNRDTVFLLDRDSHWSLWKATGHLKYGRQVFAFRHNDVDHLERLLDRAGDAAKKVVIFESIYSADGSVAPIREILDLCEKYNAISFVDDANGFMYYGSADHPFADEFAALKRATFHMVSLSKAVGLEGGAIAGPADAVFAFEGLTGTAMYTATMHPPLASAAANIIRQLRDDPLIVDGYLAAVKRFRDGLVSLGCQVNPAPSYITSILVGDEEVADQVRYEFAQHGFLVSVLRYPAVAAKQAVIRVIPHAKHVPDEIDSFLQALGQLKEKYKF